MHTLKGRFRGTLLGAAVGDALGAQFEGVNIIKRSALEELMEEPRNLRYTDDTHMMLGLASSLVECGGFNGHHMANLFARNYFAEPWRGYGSGPPQVFKLIVQGVPWHKASSLLFGGSGSYGNGAAMRVAPAGLLKYRDLDLVVRIANQSGMITHSHELGMEGAVLQACAVALLLQQPESTDLDHGAFLAALRKFVRTPIFHQKMEQITLLLPGTSRTDVVAALGNGIASYEAIPAALYSFLCHAGSFTDAVTYAISLGGDTDTIACMTGALSGAYLGEQSIPAVWRDRVEGAARLRELADALFSMATSAVSKPLTEEKVNNNHPVVYGELQIVLSSISSK